MMYNTHVRYYLATLIALTLFGVPAVTTHFGTQIKQVAQVYSEITNKAEDQFAAVVLGYKTKTVSDIQSHYEVQQGLTFVSTSTLATPHKVRILIVPGHEPTYGGAEYKDIKERNMTLELANDLSVFLSTNSHYEVFQARDNNGWNSDLNTFFKNNWSNISAWQKASVKESLHLVSTRVSVGTSNKDVPKVFHNTAPQDVAIRLFGITKWANDNDIDITVHIHFNDDTEHKSNKPGKHAGFAIYVPDSNFGNSTTTRAVAGAVFNSLEKKNQVSDLPGESAGIVNEQDLIAIGADNTAHSASMLIEYGYIYEPQFADATKRSAAIKNLAYQTYLGLENFFTPQSI